MNKYFLFILYFITSIVSTSSIAVTNISVNQFCSTNDKLLNFDEYSINPDLKVEFSGYSFDADLIVQVEDSELFADVVIKDNQDNQEYSVCKSRDGLTVKISEYSFDPDITIEISEYSFDPDVRIFHNSSIISLEEAISFLILSKLLVEN
jgi:hypothetical protein